MENNELSINFNVRRTPSIIKGNTKIRTENNEIKNKHIIERFSKAKI